MPTLKTADRVLAMVQELASKGEMTAKELSAALNANTSTTYNLLETLQARGWVTRVHGFRYRLTVQGRGNGGLRAAVEFKGPSAALATLHERTGETCYLAIKIGMSVTIVEIIEGTNSHLRVAGLRVGFSGREHLRASGRAVLAFSDGGEERFRELVSLDPDPVADLKAEDAARILQNVRETGIALDEGEFDDGIHCAAAPYFSDSGVVGSIAVSVPTTRYVAGADVIRGEVRKAAQAITEIYTA
ncbi:MAG TPA: IclR family transcriptional regulator C-terminal domain-containing protein [Egicoccus sp.]|nr:IclR family transcriptional regulator C-terminal domain-containing protein [Egicoccus sp.]HSK24614.1 IclR family transcriptional regulator C-terminal domain-containing protein [Egicoccus sp.]